MSAMSVCSSSANRRWRSAPWRIVTFSDGANFAASRCQFSTTLVGEMTKQGRVLPFSFSAKMWVSVCMVFPKPMSSAKIPCRPLLAKNCIH